MIRELRLRGLIGLKRRVSVDLDLLDVDLAVVLLLQFGDTLKQDLLQLDIDLLTTKS